MTEKLLPCPFCGCDIHLSAVARDWWRIAGDHGDDCILFDQQHDAPQTDDQKRLLIDAWNRRATQPAASAEPMLYIQSNHVTCAQRMGPFMARVSGRKEQSDWLPLYTAPVSAQPDPAMVWQDIGDVAPPRDCIYLEEDRTVGRRLLVTNNIHSEASTGQMSHVWFATPIWDKSKKWWVAFDANDNKIEGITHWLDPLNQASQPAEPTVKESLMVADPAMAGDRDCLISEALSIIRQDYSAESLKYASAEEYVQNATIQLIDAGYRKRVQPASGEDATLLDFIEKEWFYRDGAGAWCFNFNECWDAGKHNSLRAAIVAAMQHRDRSCKQ